MELCLDLMVSVYQYFYLKSSFNHYSTIKPVEIGDASTLWFSVTFDSTMKVDWTTNYLDVSILLLTASSI